MSRKLTVLGIFVAAAALCVVAIVRAQDQRPGEQRAIGVGGALGELQRRLSGAGSSDQEDEPERDEAIRASGGIPLRSTSGWNATKKFGSTGRSDSSDDARQAPAAEDDSPTDNSKPWWKRINSNPYVDQQDEPTVVAPGASRSANSDGPASGSTSAVVAPHRPASPTSMTDSTDRSGSFSRGSSLQDRLHAVQSNENRPAVSSTAKPYTPSTTQSTPAVKPFVPAAQASPTESSYAPRVAARPKSEGRVPSVVHHAAPSSEAAPTAKPVAKPTPPPTESKPTADALFTSKCPAIEVKTSGPRTAVIGKQTSYFVTVRNAGQVQANEIALQIELPDWAEVVAADASSGSAQRASAAGAYQWRLRELAAGSEQKLTLKIIPRKSRPFQLGVAWAFQPEPMHATVEVQEPKLQMAIAGPDEVRFGASEQYRLTISNPGTGDAENVTIQMTTSNSPDDGQPHSIGTIAAGQSKILQLRLKATQAGTLLVKATAAGDGGLAANVTEKVLVRRAALQVQAAGPEMTYAGTPAEYRIVIANPGNDVAENVRVEVALPSGAQLLSSSETGLAASSKGKVNWTIASLPPGEERVVDLKCSLHTAGANRLQAVATADHELADSISATTHVEALADLKLVTADPRGPVPVGQDMVYEVHLKNRGSKRATNVDMVVFFSQGVEPISVTGGPHQIEPGQVTITGINAIEANGEVVYKVTARASQPGNHAFRVEVECRDPETRLVAEETTRVYGDAAASTARQTQPDAAPREFEPTYRK